MNPSAVKCGGMVGNAIVVGLITQSALVSIMEGVLHFFIDWAKCEKLTNIHVDQALHVICKVVWVAVLWS